MTEIETSEIVSNEIINDVMPPEADGISNEPSDETLTANDPSVDAVTESAETDNSEEADVTELLRREIADLRKKLDAKENEQKQILHELGEFDRLFPETSVKDVPEEVWKRVEDGIPLSAAYALYEREQSIIRNRANEINARNYSLSAGKAGKGASEDYFSPDEVKRMSPKEVHRNFSKIKNSMKYWR